jgi:hypothetical protein
MMTAAKYLKFGFYIMAIFFVWLLLGSLLTMVAPFFGMSSAGVFNSVINSPSSATFLIALVVFFVHRRVFHRDVFSQSETGHLMVVASTAFLPVFIYITGVSLIEQLISYRYVSLTMLGDTLRHNFMVVVPVYFITLVFAGLLVAGFHHLAKKLLSMNRLRRRK